MDAVISDLLESNGFIEHLEEVAREAQRQWEETPDYPYPQGMTYTGIVVRSVVAEMVRMNRTGKVGTHLLVDEQDLRSVLSAAHSLPVTEWPVCWDLDVMKRIERAVGYRTE